MIFGVVIGGLPWFLFPRVWEIALSGEFSSWLEIAGNALF